MRVANPPFPLLLLLLLLASYFLLPRFCRCIGRSEISIKTLSGLANGGLENVLKEASMEDRTVILTLLHSADHSPEFKIFLESFQVGHGTARFLNHLIILVPDLQALRACESMHPLCYSLPAMGSNKPLRSSDQVEAQWRRNELIEEVLRLGYNFIYTDADVQWFRNPLCHFASFDMMAIAQKHVSRTQSGLKIPDGGFFYMKSFEVSIEFLKLWNMMGMLYPDSDAQSTLEMTLQDQHGFLSLLGMKVRFLELDDFGDFCQGSIDLSRVSTVRTNCSTKRKQRIRDLEILLDGWRKYTNSFGA